MKESGDIFPTRPSLDSFFTGMPSLHERVVGTYLYPPKLLGNPDWHDRMSAIEVIERIEVEANEVLITCNGGLFLRVPPDLKTLKDKRMFEEKAASLFNNIICEFALYGVVSEPATPTHISGGKLIKNFALITSVGGGREVYMERTMAPCLELIRSGGLWQINPQISLNVVQEIKQQQFTVKLKEVSTTLPTLVAGAYSLFSKRQLSEALNDSWIVNEQIIDWLWSDYKNSITATAEIEQNKRKERLSDERTYTAAVRIEVLYVAGCLPAHIYEAINNARKHRNKLAHRAQINLKMAQECLDAMRQMIEYLCGASVEPPMAIESINW